MFEDVSKIHHLKLAGENPLQMAKIVEGDHLHPLILANVSTILHLN